MENINVKFIRPTDNSAIDIGLPGNIILRDVFRQLIDANFITSGRPYTGVLKPNPTGGRKDSVPLDNDKTIGDNDVADGDTIEILISGTQIISGTHFNPSTEKIAVKIVHPTNGSDMDIDLPSNIVLQDVFYQLIDANFLTSGQPYTGVIKLTGREIFLDNTKTIRENNIIYGDIIQILMSTLYTRPDEIMLIRHRINDFFHDIETDYPNLHLQYGNSNDISSYRFADQFLYELVSLSNFFQSMAVKLYKEKILLLKLEKEQIPTPDLQEPRISIYRINNNT